MTGITTATVDNETESGFEELDEVLKSRLGASVTLPGERGWQRAAAAFNLAIDQRPAAVVQARGVSDLRAVLEIAGEYGAPVTVQPSGHGAAGNMNGAILVRPAGFDRVEINTNARTMRIGSGVLWGAVAQALEHTGLVAAYGSNPTVSVVGYLLAGGLPTFGRALGLGVRSLRAVELLTADGSHRWVDDGNEPELMWALRGAGGALGIVTAVEIDLHPAPALHGGKLLFPIEAAHEVFSTVMRETDAQSGSDLDDSLALTFSLVGMMPPDALPPFAVGRRGIILAMTRLLTGMPEFIRGKKLVSVDILGLDNPKAHRALAARLSRIARPVAGSELPDLAATQVHKVIHEPTFASPFDHVSRLTNLDAVTANRLVDVFTSMKSRSFLDLEIRLLGGALAKSDGRPGVAGAITASHLVSGHALADPSDTHLPAAFAEVSKTVQHLAERRNIATFLGESHTYAEAYEADSLERLSRVKASVDPENRIVGNREIGIPA